MPAATIARMSLLGHIQHLTENIGPRGSTTENETKAAAYIAEQLIAIGLQPTYERFLSRTSAYSPFIVAMGGALVGLFLFWQPQPVGAAAATIITLVVFASVLRELSLQDNPLRWVAPTEHSQNVALTISGQEPARILPPILVTAHIDTHRTPLLFSSHPWRQLFHVLMPVGLACIAILLALFAIGIVSDAHALRQIALAPGAIVLILFALFMQAARSPFTKGANDNASGVAVALDLAERLRDQPLRKRDVILAFTGCEEVGAYGVEAFIAAHRHHLRDAIHLVIDHVGGRAGYDDGPCVIRSERFFRRVESDAKLLHIADGVISAHSDLCARADDFDLAYSEMTVGVKHGLRVIGLMGLTTDGTLPNWHVPTDVIGNLNEATLQRAADFAWAFLRAIDAADEGDA